jgi:hypothetical protein
VEPRNESELPKTSEQQGREKKRRFQLVKLEERIAPGKGGLTNKPHACGGGSSVISFSVIGSTTQ